MREEWLQRPAQQESSASQRRVHVRTFCGGSQIFGWVEGGADNELCNVLEIKVAVIAEDKAS